MIVRYDKNALIAGIGLSAWPRLGPERWFKNYVIASRYSSDIANDSKSPVIHALSSSVAEYDPKQTTQELIEQSAFQDMLIDKFKNYVLFAYKSIRVPERLKAQGITIVDSVNTDTDFENKVLFRQVMADAKLPFPRFKIYDRHSLQANMKTLSQLLANRPSVILQDEKLSGGKGTFVIRTLKDLDQALTMLARTSKGKQVVVSEHINPRRERSVQCCATRHGVFVGPLQRQIIGNASLFDASKAAGHDTNRFCGAEIVSKDSLTPLYEEVKKYAITIGERLLGAGYRGIFSVDYLIDDKNNLYILEVNPRITGITPLVTALYREGKDIPFYLLHILETTDMDYEIVDNTLDPDMFQGSLLMLRTNRDMPVRITNTLASGRYSSNAQYISNDRNIQENDFLLQQYSSSGSSVQAHGSFAVLLSKETVLDARDNLRPEIVSFVRYIQQHTHMKEEKQI